MASVDPDSVGPGRTGPSGHVPVEAVAPAGERCRLVLAGPGQGGAVGQDHGLARRRPAQVQLGGDVAEHDLPAAAATGGAGEVARRERQDELAQVHHGTLRGGGGQVVARRSGGVAAEAREVDSRAVHWSAIRPGLAVTSGADPEGISPGSDTAIAPRRRWRASISGATSSKTSSSQPRLNPWRRALK